MATVETPVADSEEIVETVEVVEVVETDESGDIDERIASRAYEIYLSGAEGSDVDHWLQAEGEIRGES